MMCINYVTIKSLRSLFGSKIHVESLASEHSRDQNRIVFLSPKS